MKEVKILVVEDDPLYAIELERMVHELGYIPLDAVDNAKSALEVIALERIDLILMDISIKGEMDGIELGAKISPLKIPVVFLTSHNDDQYFERAKAAGMHAYLIKPFNQFTLSSVIDSALETKEDKIEPTSAIQNTVSDSLFIKTNNKLNRVKFSAIHYILAEGNYVEIITDTKKYAFKISLRRIIGKLPSDIFFQIHRGYLVNIDLIENIDLSRNEVQLSKHKLPIGGRYKEGLLKKLNQL